MALRSPATGQFLLGAERDLTGMRFDRWVVLSCAERGNIGQIRWLCRCDCGVERSVGSANLQAKKNPSKSCGCLKLEKLQATIPAAERFDAHWEAITVTGCQLWLGGLSKKGYGQFALERRREVKQKTVRAHRFAYERQYGAIPHGLELDHTCRVRCCVNPQHLEAVTHAENLRRAAEYRRSLQCT